jgi:hypothetical protein
MTKEELLEEYGDLVGYIELVTADGFDDAILGIDSKSYRVIYDADIMVEILMEDEDMSEEEALEYLDYNVFNAWIGDQTPIYLI